MRLRTLIRWLAIACGVLALALALFVLSFDLNQYRRPLEAAASKALGRTVTLGGPLTLVASLSPTIAAEQVRIANPAWASRPHLAEAAHAEIQIDLLPLFHGQLMVRQLLLMAPIFCSNQPQMGPTTGRSARRRVTCSTCLNCPVL